MTKQQQLNDKNNRENPIWRSCLRNNLVAEARLEVSLSFKKSSTNQNALKTPVLNGNRLLNGNRRLLTNESPLFLNGNRRLFVSPGSVSLSQRVLVLPESKLPYLPTENAHVQMFSFHWKVDLLDFTVLTVQLYCHRKHGGLIQEN